MSIFTPRTQYKPFEYPDVVPYGEAIQHAYWLHSEFNFQTDVHDFKVKVAPHEQTAVKNAILAISQIEVQVKMFWGNIGNHIRKPEIAEVGLIYGESEVRHARAYSHLLEVMGLNAEFARIDDVPSIRGRKEYLGESLSGLRDADEAGLALATTLFSIFVENVSLFGQFVVMKSFARYRNLFKEIDNVVQATQQEERLHAAFGAWLVNQMRHDRPDLFGEAFNESLRRACQKAYRAEVAIVDWIFEDGELDFLPKSDLVEYLKHRFNGGLASIGVGPEFEPDLDAVERLRWFDQELNGKTNIDFFHKRSTNYAKKTCSVSADDLFE